ncbi:amino acid adenylation domain-containing protein [Streptomyces sp. NPDC096323]|uniref:amino acid adenylation domain-containing protein n=1 Tax=Streptomyces sp. NPDC096323 TaxID=3155822 RepID=UPI0033347CAA
MEPNSPAVAPRALLCQAARPDAAVVVYAIAHAGAGAAPWNPVAAALPDSVELKSVRLPGRESRIAEPTHTTVPEAAEEVARVIAADAREHGKPVLVVGSCFGAMVGLAALGLLPSDVAALGLLAVRQPIPGHIAPPGGARPASMDARQLRAWLRDYRLTPAALLDDDHVYEFFEPLLRADLTMTDGWSFDGPPLRAPVFLLQGTDAGQALDAEAWSAVTRAPVHVHGLAAGGDPLTEHPALLADAIASVARQALTGVARRAPASPAQRRLWFEDVMHRREGRPAAYHSVMSVRMREAVDRDLLADSLALVRTRHEVLRTRLELADGELHQLMDAPGTPVRLPLVDVPGRTPQEREEALLELMRAEFEKPFDLGADAVFRAQLFRLAPDEHELQLVVHHVATDGWSMDVLLRELSDAYAAKAEGRPPLLPDLPIQYADYSVRQHKRIASPAFDDELAYWLAHLEEAPRVLELPTDRPRPPVQSYRTGSLTFALPDDLAAQACQVAKEQRVSLYMLLLTTLQITMSRWTGLHDLVIGTPVANRAMPDTQRLIGFFVNLLPLRLRTDESLTFAEALKRTRTVALDAHDHQAVSFDQLVEAIAPERSLTHAPVFQVLFSLAEPHDGGPNALGVLSDVDYGVESNLDLTFVAETQGPKGEGLALWTAYSSDLFDGETIQRLLERFTEVLRSVVVHPGATLATLPVTTEAERSRLGTFASGPRLPVGGRLVDVLRTGEPARGRQDEMAVDDGGASLTHRELHRRSDRIARHLLEHGVGPDKVVGACLPRGADLVVALTAVIKAGGVYLPLDQAHPMDRLRYMVDDSAACAVLTDARGTALDWPAERPVLEVAALTEPDTEEPAETPWPPVHPDNLAYVIYTSGSTGRPKAVQVTHRGIDNFIAWYVDEFRLTAEDRVSQLGTPSCDASLLDMLPALTAGSRLVVVPEDTHLAFDQLWDYFARTGVTASFMVTPTLTASAAGAPAAHPTLTRLGVGGERLPSVPEGLPCPLSNLYGPTEATIAATAGRLVPGAPSHVGTALANTRTYVLDQWLRPVPPGVAGELYLSGPHLARGYSGRSGLTARTFLPDVIAGDGGRMYRTGDQARWTEDGALDFLGRMDRQVKVRGFRVELEEIERAIASAPGVRETVVLLREDLPTGAGLVAYCRVAPGDAAESGWVEKTHRHASEHLPAHMVPSAWIGMEHFPLNKNGKVDRKALAVLEVPKDGGPTGEYTAPEGAIQELVAEVWQEVLGADRVSAMDDFFHLGGHSLLIVRVVSRLEAALGMKIRMTMVFEYPVLRELAARLEESVLAHLAEVEA